MGYAPFASAILKRRPEIEPTVIVTQEARSTEIEPAVIVTQEAPLVVEPSPVASPSVRVTPKPTDRPNDRPTTFPSAPSRRRLVATIALGVGAVVVFALVLAFALRPDNVPASNRTSRTPAAPFANPKSQLAIANAATPSMPVTAVATTAAPVAPVATPPATPAVQIAVAGRGSCSVQIDSDAPSSVVLIDGRVMAEAPLRVDGLFCGRRVHVAVANPRLAPWDRWVAPEEGKLMVLKASLRHLTTAVVITSTPSGATVRVNGRDVGPTPAAISVVADASEHVEVSSPHFAPFQQTITARAGTTTTIEARLTAEATPSPSAKH